jgi:hypothetical protein
VVTIAVPLSVATGAVVRSVAGVAVVDYARSVKVWRAAELASALPADAGAVEDELGVLVAALLALQLGRGNGGNLENQGHGGDKDLGGKHLCDCDGLKAEAVEACDGRVSID